MTPAAANVSRPTRPHLPAHPARIFRPQQQPAGTVPSRPATPPRQPSACGLSPATRSPQPAHALQSHPPTKALLALLALLLAPGCGYHVAGQADTIPTRIRTVAVSPFENVTTEYKIEQYMTSAVAREFISRTRYQVINDPAQADAKLTGAVVQFFAFPQNLDPVSGRATTVTTITRVQVSLVDRQTGEVLYQNPDLSHREQYQVSADAGAYFEEREAAVARATESMARRLVSAVLEGF